MSSDPYLSVNDDRLLGEVLYAEGLAVGESCSRVWNGAVPGGVAGPYYIVVSANAGPAFRESLLLNNNRASRNALAVEVRAMANGVAATGTVSQGEWVFFKYEAQAGRTVRFVLDSAADAGVKGLYIRQGLPPTVSTYDAAAVVPGQTDQEAQRSLLYRGLRATLTLRPGLLQCSGGTYRIGHQTGDPARGGQCRPRNTQDCGGQLCA